MPEITVKQQPILRQLGDGLVLRRAAPGDADALVSFNAGVLSEDGQQQPDARIGAWTRDLIDGPHPTFRTGDFTLVEDIRSGQIVSSLGLISQTWSFAGVPIGVGRPELVGTLPEYRGRGLVRAQFETVHAWSAERGEKLQAITGIPYFYRQFGYEMGLNLGGGRLGYGPDIPRLKQGEHEPYAIRPARETDLSFIADLYQQANQRYLVSCLRDEALWRYELLGKSQENVNRWDIRLIQSRDGRPVGYLAHPFSVWRTSLNALAYELVPGASWAEVTPSVIRYLYTTGERYAARDGKEKDFGAFGFWLGAEHPVYRVLRGGLSRQRKPYAWYVRIADLPDFLRRITPVLEQRLAGSSLAGHSGNLKITFYRSGLLLEFENGRLAKIAPWQPEPVGHSGDIAFPDLTFLQLLFGYRSLEELNYAFADCWWEKDETFGLVDALFPKQVSNIWPVS
jgi:hypothetical protein